MLVGLGVAAGSFSIVLAAFARHTPPERRSIVFGIGTAAGSAGMFLFAPISQGLIDAYGWSDSLVYIGIAMLALPILAIPLAGNSRSGKAAMAEMQQSIGAALREALRPPQLRAADHRLLRLRLPDRLHHRPFPGLYPRHRHRRRATPSSRWR